MTSTALSTNWRVNKSNIQYIEMANAIRELRKVVGTIDTSARSVLFGHMGDSFNSAEAKLISIDPAYALKNCPIEPEDFDVLVGLAAHEAGHSLVDSYRILKGSLNVYDTQEIKKIGEEIYVDCYIIRHFSVLGKYIKASRNAYRTDSNNINWSSTLTAWGAMSVYNIIPPQDITTKVAHELSLVLAIARPLSQQDCDINGRSMIYQQILRALEEAARMEENKEKSKRLLSKSIAPQEEDAVSEALDKLEDPDARPLAESESPKEAEDESDKDEANEEPKTGQTGVPEGDNSNTDTDDASESSDGSGEDNEDEGPKGDPTNYHGTVSQNLSPQLLKAIEEALDLETEDFTSTIEGLSAEGTSIPYPILYQLASGKRMQNFDPLLTNGLYWINSIKNSIGKETYHGEEEGVIDQQRLYRAAIDGKPFKRTVKLPRKDIDLVLLLDASGSMSDKEIIYTAAASLHKVIPNSLVTSYSSSSSGTVVTSLNASQRLLHRPRIDGGTPSGEALLVMAIRKPNSLIIHFTDGDSNKGIKVPAAMDIISNKYPGVCVVDIRLGIETRNAPSRKNYKIVYISEVSHFPEALRNALRDWYRQ